MKLFTLLTLLSLTVSFASFAGETTTDCPMMSESNDRSNPKASQGSVQQPKEDSTRKGSVQ